MALNILQTQKVRKFKKKKPKDEAGHRDIGTNLRNLPMGKAGTTFPKIK